MTRLVLYSDLHIRPERIEDCETVLKFVGEFAQQHDAIIINGGDTFNTRGLLRTHCFDALYTHYNEWQKLGLKQIIIVGNHDQEDKIGEIHPMRVFASFKDWHVVDKPQLIDGMGFSSYVQNTKDAIAKMRGAKDIFVHWGFKGAKRNGSNVDSDGVDLESVAHFRRVFSGHYHLRQEIENAQYIGSPIQQNQGERDQEKGVLLYDTKTQKVTFHPIPGTRKHYDIEVSFVDGKATYSGDIKKITPIDYVRTKVIGDIESVSNFSKEQVSKKIKCADVKIDREISEKHFTRLNIKSEEIQTPVSLMEKYVGFIETGLDKSKLLKIGKEIIGA